MNFNAIIAVLILKSILTQDEGDRLVEHLNDKPQSTVLRDAIAAVAEVIGKPQAAIMPQIGPVGPAQIAETLADHSAVVEPQLAANDPVLDADQANVETNKEAKTTSVKKSAEEPKKK